MSARAYIEPGKIPPAVKELLETLRRGGLRPTRWGALCGTCCWESSPMTGM